MSNVPPPPPPSYPQGGYGAPPPLPPGVPPGKVKLRGRIPLRLALIFGVIGVALCVLGVVVIVNSPLLRIDDFPRVPVNQQQSVQLDSGKTVVYFETPSNGSHRAYVRMEVLGPDGNAVDLGRYGNSLTYTLDGRHGEALFTFDAPTTGTYRVLSRSDDAPPGAELSFGESVVGGIVAGVLTFIPGLLLVIAAVVLLIVGLVKRSGHKRELASGYQGHPGPNYYTGQ